VCFLLQSPDVFFAHYHCAKVHRAIESNSTARRIVKLTPLSDAELRIAAARGRDGEAARPTAIL